MFFRGLCRSILPLGCLLIPTLAQAQTFSPAGLATAQPLSMVDLGGPAGNVAPVQFTLFGQLSERYTSNALGTSASSQPDYDTQAVVSATGSAQTAHTRATLSYSGSLDYFANNSSNVIFSNYLNAHGLTELLPDHLFLSADAYSSPVYATGLGNLAAPGETLPAGANSDLRNTYGFDVQPDVTFRLGDFVRSDLEPSYSAVFIDQPVGANSAVQFGIPIAHNITTAGVTERLTSGDFFNRLQWSAIASYSQTGHSTGGLIQRSGTGELSYAVTRSIALIGDVGYQSVTADIALSKELSGPIFLGGLKFDFAKLNGEFRAGEQYHSFSLVGHLVYQITPSLTALADAQDSVNTPGAGLLSQNSLLQALQNGIAAGQISVAPSATLTAGNAALGVLGLQNENARIRTDSVSLQYGFNALSFSMTAYLTSQDAVTVILPGENPNLQTESLTAASSYAFTPSLRGSVDVTYSHQILPVGSDNVVDYQAQLNYSLSDKTYFYFETWYLQRVSNQTLASVSVNSGSFSETSVIVGVRQQF